MAVVGALCSTSGSALKVLCWQHCSPPFPPVRGPTRLLSTLGTAGALELAHLMLLPASLMAQQLFEGDAARLLLLGNAMHADVPIDAPGSGVMGYLLIMMAQDGGFPVPVGGAGQLTAALVHRAASAGAQIDCQRPVSAIDVNGGRAVAVRTAGGDTVQVRRAVIADTSAPQLYQSLLPADALPESLAKPRAFCLGHTRSQRQLRVERHHPVAVGKSQRRRHRPSRRRSRRVDPPDGRPEHRDASRPSVHVVRTDDDRRPQPVSRRAESAWAYTHLPRGMADDESADKLSAAVDRVLEEHAPGFTERVVGKVIQRPSDLEGSDANLHTGAVNGGTSQLYQQLIFRPTPGFGRAETPVENLYLGSAGANPGGGVHGMCGRNAARAALRRGHNGLAAPTAQPCGPVPDPALTIRSVSTAWAHNARPACCAGGLDREI
jgi:phytoene dehydrogenase-like protein